MRRKDGARSWRLRGLLAVIAIMVVLTAGWTPVNAAISGTVPLSGGQTLTVSSDGSPPVQITVGPGWSQRSSGGGCVLSRGGTSLTIDPVMFAGRPSAARIWSGLGRVVLIGDPSARLGAPSLMRSRQGRDGLVGGLAGPGRAALAAVFSAPGGGFAIEMVATGKPGSSAADLAPAQQVIRSVSFPGVGR